MNDDDTRDWDVIGLIGGGVVKVHPPSRCQGGTCCIHNPSDHPMIDWPQDWDTHRCIMMRICPHGISHPDPDAAEFLEQVKALVWRQRLMHGCDGCCDVFPMLLVAL